jgi:hypothetical protein
MRNKYKILYYFQSLFIIIFQCYDHKWWKWQTKFQYFLHQFLSHFSPIEVKLNWIQIQFNAFINLISIEFEKNNQIWFEFNSSYMQCHSILSFEWNFICNFFFFLISLSLVMHSNVKPKLINHSTVFPKKKQKKKTMYFCFLCDSVF